jgi:GNAT superfamily N-acetyltransferase
MMHKLTKKDDIKNKIKEFTNMEFLENSKTYVDDAGLISYFLYKGNPILQHFYVYPEHRKIENARKLIKDFIELLKKKGFKVFIVSSKKTYLNKVIEYYFKVKPRSINDTKYYLVEV